MPKKNIKGGSGYKKRKKIVDINTNIVKREDDQTYGKIIKLLGNGRAEVQCYFGEENVNDGIQVKTKMGTICGRMRKRVWINNGDYVLVSIRDFEPDKVDIIHKYRLTDITELKKYIKCDGSEQAEVSFEMDTGITLGHDNKLDNIKEVDEDDIDDL